jgi:hypothetical protein
MITNNDRSKWFGASDTSMLFANTNTKSFTKWWLTKLGLIKNNFNNIYMITGNALEHSVIDLISANKGISNKKGTKPVYKPFLRLRVNYDGITEDSVIEVKTSKKIPASPPKNYWRQCQVLMYATGKKRTQLWYYKLSEENYKNYFLELDASNLYCFEIKYDEKFINDEYLPRLKQYSNALRRKEFVNCKA